MQLLQCTAAPAEGNGQCNSCDTRYGVVCCAALRSAVVCDCLWCVVLCGGGSVLWSHDVCCGVLSFHVVWLVWLVEWCVGCLARWVVWQLGLFVGCLAS